MRLLSLIVTAACGSPRISDELHAVTMGGGSGIGMTIGPGNGSSPPCRAAFRSPRVVSCSCLAVAYLVTPGGLAVAIDDDHLAILDGLLNQVGQFLLGGIRILFGVWDPFAAPHEGDADLSAHP